MANHSEAKIAIVGMGGIYPSAAGRRFATSPDELWELVLHRTDTAREVPPGRWLLSAEEAFDAAPGKPDHVYSKRGCFLDLPPLDLTGLDLPSSLVAELDAVYRLTLHAGVEAFCSAATDSLDRRRVGVILGMLALPTEKASALALAYLGRTFAEKARTVVALPTAPNPLDRYAVGFPAAVLAKALRLGGGSCTLDAACASSLYALKLAVAELQAGRADAMLAGGVSRPDSLYTQMGFSQLRALSPSGRCAPFDARADGLVVGEGAGIFVLKRLNDAVRAGDRILGVIAGIGISNDIGGRLLAPSSEGQLRAMRAAYEQAGWAPGAVDLIECHATGTPVGDAVEFESLKTLWGADGWRRAQCILGSVKATVGHLLTAAGAAGVTKVLAAFRTGLLPPTANFETPAPAIDLDSSPFRILSTAAAWQRRAPEVPRRAAVSAFGFGGINAHLLLEEYIPAAAANNIPDPRPASSPIAVVAMAAHVGPWKSLRAVQERLLGGGLPVEPEAPRHWWGIEESDWFRGEGRTPLAGFFLGEVAINARRFRIPPRELEEMLPQQLLLLGVAADAFEKVRLSKEVRLRTGAFIGCGLDLNTTNYAFRWSIADPHLRDVAHPALTANRTMGGLASIAASRVAREFALGGPSFTLSAEENSGIHALDAALRMLQQGEVDAALVGAVDLPGDPRMALTADQTARGELVGEGAVVLILKRLDDAVRDGDTIHALVRGIGFASGGGITTASPETTAHRLAVERAYEDANIAPASVDHLETTDVTTVGHTGAAAGLVSVFAACVRLDQQILPSKTAVKAPCYWLRDRAVGPRRAGVAVSGGDGNVGHVVLEEMEAAAHANRPDRRRPLGLLPEALFVVEGRDRAELANGLAQLRHFGNSTTASTIAETGRAWFHSRPPSAHKPLAIALVARDRQELTRLLAAADRAVRDDAGEIPAPLRDRLFFTPRSLGRSGELAFVFPGSGNDFAGMGRDIAAHWPEVLRRQDAENRCLRSEYVADRYWFDACERPPSARERLFAQVSLGTLIADLLATFGVRPSAAIGHSLGETTALFALRAWTDRDGMLDRLNASTLFAGDLTAPFAAARRAWNLPEGTSVDWSAGVVDRAAPAVRAALNGLTRCYLLMINTPGECVIAGDRNQLAEAVRRLGASFFPLAEPCTVHCPPAHVVAEAYRDLHRLPTTAPVGVRFYSSALGRAFEIDSDTAAEAILAQALDTVDFPRVVEAAYQDGARLFVEVGPGASCSRMIGAILGDRPHRVRSACVPGTDGSTSVLQLLAMLIAERVAVDLRPLYDVPASADSTIADKKSLPVVVPVGGRPFVIAKPVGESLAPGGTGVGVRGFATSKGPLTPDPSPPKGRGEPRRTDSSRKPLPAELVTLRGEIDQAVVTEGARAEAHSAYLRYTGNMQGTVAASMAMQTTLLARLNAEPADWGVVIAERSDDELEPLRPPRSLERGECLDFAVGSVAGVLGPEFAEVDSLPTRVRLPDEPLMLVDRILEIEGEPGSLTNGRVITEHDIHPGAWYLDGGRIPTCIAVEAGQADLFLSGYLGIDFRTRGLAVYRLLDAIITFHRALPGPRTAIVYDIHIDRFFRQGQTHLFRFRFEGSVNGAPLLTMTDGCAGFFTAEELAAGKGVVRPALDRRTAVGSQPDDEGEFVPREPAAFGEAELEALRQGDLGRCFGPSFRGLPLSTPLTIPGGRMKLVDRVTELDPRGGRYGIGSIRAEYAIRPDAWYLVCHFIDDQVMPGTLMYECCLHTLRIFLLRLGWLGENGAVVWEPVPSVASRLRCRGQVTPTTRLVTYEVTLKERGYRPEPYTIADALIYADGKPIVEIVGMSLRLTGQTREGLRALWSKRKGMDGPKIASRALFGPEKILAFSNGNPSEAFGEPYRVFDKERVIARLPGPPYQFLDRIVHIDGCEPWQMRAGGVIEAEYDVPPSAWYFTAERAPIMPFAVLLEVALQPCGWLAAYLGSALSSPVDLAFRNLGGRATLVAPVRPDAGTLTTRVKITGVSSSGGMIIQNYDFEVRDRHQVVYRGSTMFGFFTRQALAQQVGLRDVQPFSLNGDTPARSFSYPQAPPFPAKQLRMIDHVDLFLPEGGPQRLGFIRGVKDVDPSEWFFAAHFFQDPVWPGSLGLEAMLQLLKIVASEKWPKTPAKESRANSELRTPNSELPTGFLANVGSEHRWLYRGQVIPTDRRVTVQAAVTGVDDARRRLTADGLLEVDGRIIYKMSAFTLWSEP